MSPHSRRGPWLVALGAALWGTESAWRIPLNDLFDAEVIVFWEHVLILLVFLPLLLARLGEIPRIDRRAWGWLIFSGFAGSASARFFHPLSQARQPDGGECDPKYSAAFFHRGSLPFFGDRLRRGFFLFAALAIGAGMFLSVEHPLLITQSFERAGLNRGTGFALVCAFFWGLSTVVGRGVMTGMSLRLAASLRIVVGLFCMTVILLFHQQLNGHSLWPAAAQAHPGKAIGALLLLATVSGAVPLLIYFEGLRLTKASTAGYFEMMQTLAAVCVTWGFFHAALRPHQVVAGVILLAAAALVQRVQEQTPRANAVVRDANAGPTRP